jgi:DUF2075 family protein
MIIYCDTVRNFIDDCSETNPYIGQRLNDEFKKRRIGGGANSEYNSWIHSLPKVAKVLNDNAIPKDVYVGVEYKLIDTKQRVDFLIYGKDENDIENVVLIELKQWSTVRRSTMKDYVYTDGGHGSDNYWHPSYQAFNYANIMKSFNEYIYENKVGINACSYLHNMDDGYKGILNDQKSYPLVHEAPTFLKDDQKKLAEFIFKYIKKPYKQTLYEIDGSQIKPSATFSKMVVDAIKGQPFFSYDAEQSYSVSRIVDEVQEALGHNERRTIIIKGGPGSGKSVVAVNALGQLLHPENGEKRRNVCYVTANFTPRTYFGDILVQNDFTKRAIKELFKTPAAFAKTGEIDFDCIIVDEAHRMLKWKFGWGIKKDIDIIDNIFQLSRVNVFLIDEDQVVTTSDDLSIKQIKEYADKYGSIIIEGDRLNLTSQFRCVGGEKYIDFVNKILGYENNFSTIRNIRYDVKIMDSMDEMMKEWKKWNDKGHQFRLLASYTHEWISKDNENLYDFDYENGKIKLKWNIQRSDRSAILDQDQIQNVFCIHTIQGLEVEYAGVIIGKDITYNKVTREIEYHKDKIAKSDNASGIRTASDELARRLIRNTYKVLLTRGVKGTYIYAEDDDLREYLKAVVKM